MRGGISSSPASRQVHVGGISSSPSSRRTNSCGRRSEGFLLPPYPGKAFQFIPDEGPFSPAEEIRLFFIVSPVNCGKVDAGNDRGELVEQLAEQKYDLQPRLFLFRQQSSDAAADGNSRGKFPAAALGDGHLLRVKPGIVAEYFSEHPFHDLDTEPG